MSRTPAPEAEAWTPRLRTATTDHRMPLEHTSCLIEI
ncbi:hypothetical protein MAR_022742 [Mya arenaria]|uniref:Uncharacterized protein n=1 Tax=Mya arenaria TaxID=6604 RepID=A0ABY7DL08_MYAAR|nr:hypothetical protein MAR_022742 [Mya arenaria]